MKNNFLQRAVTGVLFVVVMAGSILYSPMSFGIVFMLIAALTISEFGHLINRSALADVNRVITALGGAYLFLAIMAYCADIADARVFLPYLLLWLYLVISEIYARKENPLGNWAFSALSQLYVALPFALLNVLAFHNGHVGGVSYNPILPLSVFIFIWLSDSGAYCIGTLLGRHRLFPSISPKKSWEGSIGGGVCAIIAAFVLARFFPFLPLWQWVGLAIVVVVFGTWGDLTESLLKRRLGIKDSGTILPGHGGMLDRFDSSLMAIPAAVVYLYVISLYAF
ncbi:MAG: phosphatidate cytidylyltransferase [Prevotellaceae bacterium]|nr:phosphatidate cytidylyltransferase [Prevotellaceae bacterium]